jgi:hypothetical protein
MSITINFSHLSAMNDIQLLHQKAMEFAEQAEVAKLRGAAIEQIQQLLRSAFEQESQAAALVVNVADAEPTRSVLHRSAAALAIDCGELQAAERLMTTALAGDPPDEIALELKDLFVQINLPQYFERRGLPFNVDWVGQAKIA